MKNMQRKIVWGGEFKTGGNFPPKGPGKNTESLGIEHTIILNMAFILFCIVSANEKNRNGRGLRTRLCFVQWLFTRHGQALSQRASMYVHVKCYESN